MIPRDYVTEWRAQAPWNDDDQVEQDLMLSRAIVEIFRVPEVAEALAFRGGTALHKLYLAPAARYSEDIDLVRTGRGPVGDVYDALRGALDPWLGDPKRIRKEHSASLIYRMRAEGTGLPMRLKVEINTSEAFSIQGHVWRSYDLSSRWFSGTASVRTFPIEELLGTKLRALYQRRKSRDLFDLWLASGRAAVDPDGVVSCFRQYMAHGGHQATRAQFEANLHAKLHDPLFTADLTPLLAPGLGWDIEAAGRYVRDELLSRLPGEPWKGPGA